MTVQQTIRIGAFVVINIQLGLTKNETNKNTFRYKKVLNNQLGCIYRDKSMLQTIWPFHGKDAFLIKELRPIVEVRYSTTYSVT